MSEGYYSLDDAHGSWLATDLRTTVQVERVARQYLEAHPGEGAACLCYVTGGRTRDGDTGGDCWVIRLDAGRLCWERARD